MASRAIVIALLSNVLPAFAHGAAPPAPVPRTGQTACYEGTIATICTGTGQDGDTLAGVSWPIPRFTDKGDQTLADQLTGLVWAKDANPANGSETWQQALDSVKTLNSRNYLGHDDWRLPNVNELQSLVNTQPNLTSWLTSQGFHDIQLDSYWTSSTYASYAAYAWSVGTYSGIVAARGKAEGGYVWPVRGGQSGSVPKTGQTACFDDAGSTLECAGTGQDGNLQRGVTWPSPRFADNADQTMTDKLTGLMWSKDAQAPGPAVCKPGTSRTWEAALEYVGCLNSVNFLGKRDWRLPNRNELARLVNHGQANSSTWLKEQGFTNVQASSYWSSSTYPYNVWNAWSINMHDGAVTSMAKKHDIQVWPVRGGEQPDRDLPKKRAEGGSVR